MAKEEINEKQNEKQKKLISSDIELNQSDLPAPDNDLPKDKKAETAANTFEYASIWRRIVASLIDAIILVPMVLFTIVVIGSVLTGSSIIDILQIPFAAFEYETIWRFVLFLCIPIMLVKIFSLFFLCALTLFVPVWPIAHTFFPNVDNNAVGALVIFYFFLIFLVYILDCIYQIACDACFDGTLGKKLVGIKIVDKSGKKITIIRSFNKYALKTLFAPILGVIISLFTITRSKKKQALHDMFSGCFVIRAEAKKTSLAKPTKKVSGKFRLGKRYIASFFIIAIFATTICLSPNAIDEYSANASVWFIKSTFGSDSSQYLASLLDLTKTYINHHNTDPLYKNTKEIILFLQKHPEHIDENVVKVLIDSYLNFSHKDDGQCEQSKDLGKALMPILAKYNTTILSSLKKDPENVSEKKMEIAYYTTTFYYDYSNFFCDYKEAMATYQSFLEALAYKPNNNYPYIQFKCLCFLGQAKMKLEDFASAAKCWQQADNLTWKTNYTINISANSDYERLPRDYSPAQILQYLGNCYNKIGEYKKAEIVLEKCKEIDSGNSATTNLPDIEIVIELAQTYMYLGKYDKAEALLKNGARFSDPGVLSHALGNLYSKTKKYDLADKAYSKAIESWQKYYSQEKQQKIYSIGDPELYNDYAKLLKKINQPLKAIEMEQKYKEVKQKTQVSVWPVNTEPLGMGPYL